MYLKKLTTEAIDFRK